MNEDGEKAHAGKLTIASDRSEGIDSVRSYYERSNRELSQRYLTERFSGFSRSYFLAAIQQRYELYPHIVEIADFDAFRSKKVLEVGVGQGVDHFMFAKAGADLTGVDVTEKHCAITSRFLKTFGLLPRIVQSDVCNLPYPDHSFDHVYSCGVLLLIRRIDLALAEIRRVLRPGGFTTIMLYNKASIHYYVKTRLYYGWVLNESRMLGKDIVTDWYTDGIGYPKTYHYSPRDLPRLFQGFSRVEYRRACLTPEQLPEVGLPKRESTRRWLESRFGFFLWVKAWL